MDKIRSENQGGSDTDVEAKGSVKILENATHIVTKGCKLMITVFTTTKIASRFRST